MNRSIKRLIALAITAVSLTGLVAAQTPDHDPAMTALLKRVQELERTLAEVKTELAERSQKAVTAIVPTVPPPVVTSPVPSDVNDAAVAMASDNHTLGPLQFRGYSDLGFGRALFEKLPPGGLAGSSQSFTIGDFDLFVSSHLTDHLSFLGEALITSDFSNDFGAEMDRLMLTYNANKYFSISAGKFNTAIGYYTNEFHRARYFQTATGRPLLFADEDNGGILPVHSIGLTATGAIPTGSLNVHWVAEVANGRGSQSPSAAVIQNFVDENNGKAVNFALYARPEWVHGLEVGASFYRDKLHPEAILPIEQRIYSAHVALVRPHLELLAEGVLLQHDLTLAKQKFNTYSSYAQASYQMRQIRPYFRYDYQNVPAGDPIFGTLGRENGPSVGVRYDFSEFGAFKVQYGQLQLRSGPSTNVVQAQIAFAF